jgi:hypothetical protein
VISTVCTVYNSEATRAMTKPSRAFWPIGLFCVIWNALGCFNFILQMDPGAAADLPAAYQAVIASRPGWVTAALSIAVLVAYWAVF